MCGLSFELYGLINSFLFWAWNAYQVRGSIEFFSPVNHWFTPACACGSVTSTRTLCWPRPNWWRVSASRLVWSFVEFWRYRSLNFQQSAGYNYVNIDDCWAEKNRSTSGDLVAGDKSITPVLSGHSRSSFFFYPDQLRFKSGMKTLTDQIHALGL